MSDISLFESYKSTHSPIFYVSPKNENDNNDILNNEPYFRSDDNIEDIGNKRIDYDNIKKIPSFPLNPPSNDQPTHSSENNILNNLNSTSYRNQEVIKNVKEIAKDNNENIIDNKNDEKNLENNLFLNKKRKNAKNNNKTPKENKRRGRKKMNDERDIAEHTKHSEDNMITKIKTFIINAIIVLLNNSFIHLSFSDFSSKNKKFLKISPKIYITKQRDTNLKMLKSTTKDLLYNDICTKFKNNSVKKDHNKKLIDDIYSQRTETDVIKILDLTFGEFLDFFRGTIPNELKTKLSLITNVRTKFMNIDSFFDKVREQEKRAGEKDKDIDEYIENLRIICLKYEKWFEKKCRRDNRNQKIKI